LLGDTVAGAEAAYKLETKLLKRELDRQFDDNVKAVKEGKQSQQVLADQQAALIEEYGIRERELEQEKQEKISRNANDN